MDDFNKEELDTLFQEGSERYDFPYREDAWAAMDGMLDEQDEKRKKRMLGWWILTGLIGLVGVTGMIFYYVNAQEVAEAVQIAAQMPEESGTIADNETDYQNSEAVTSGIVDRHSTVSEEEDTISDFTNPLPGAEVITGLKNKKQRILTKKMLPSSVVDYSKSEHILTLPKSTIIGVNEISKSTIIEKSIVENRTIKALASSILIPLVDNSEPLAAIDLKNITLKLEEKNEDDQKRESGNRFSVGLSGGPEFSFVGGTSQAKAGYYLGLELGYQLSDHLEIISGLGISKKRYLGDGANYKAAPGFWTDEIVPMEFAGKCTVVEIPVAVNYYFKNARQNGWFASLGATTYLMSSEWYDFIYDPAINRTDLKASWNDKMVNNHLLGVGQISFGYQQHFGKHTSLQISPYAKIPLTGIGNGAVNLFSTGLRLTARFK